MWCFCCCFLQMCLLQQDQRRSHQLSTPSDDPLSHSRCTTTVPTCSIACRAARLKRADLPVSMLRLKDLCFQVRRGSLLSQPRSVLQKLASISEGNPLAPRNSKGFLFHTLSPEKDGSASGVPQKQVRERPPCTTDLGGQPLM